MELMYYKFLACLFSYIFWWRYGVKLGSEKVYLAGAVTKA